MKKRSNIRRKNVPETTLTHLEKIYWTKEKITKGAMIEYYQAVAPYLLPHLHNRPLMLHRYPEGIEKGGFYQKNLEKAPDWIKTFTLQHENRKVEYVLVQDLPTLLYVANLGSIELHPMIAQFKTVQKPDFIALDLDPEDLPFQKVVDCALVAHELLLTLKIPHYCKTSGGRGLHIYIPLHARYPFSQTEPFALLLAHLMQQVLPDLISLERSPKKRQKKIYVDYLQNIHGGRTMVAPYSIRAKPNAPVSTPLAWKEVNQHLNPLDFTIYTVPKRIAKLGDLFQPVLSETIDLKNILKKLEKIPFPSE